MTGENIDIPLFFEETGTRFETLPLRFRLLRRHFRVDLRASVRGQWFFGRVRSDLGGLLTRSRQFRRYFGDFCFTHCIEYLQFHEVYEPGLNLF